MCVQKSLWLTRGTAIADKCIFLACGARRATVVVGRAGDGAAGTLLLGDGVAPDEGSAMLQGGRDCFGGHEWRYAALEEEEAEEEDGGETTRPSTVRHAGLCVREDAGGMYGGFRDVYISSTRWLGRKVAFDDWEWQAALLEYSALL